MNDISLYEPIPALENNFTVKFIPTYNTGTSMLIPHWHEHIELLYFSQGNCTFTCNGETFRAHDDDLVVVNSSEIHSYVANEDIHYFCLLIFPEFFSDIKFSNILIENLIHRDKYIKDCFDDIFKEYSINSEGSDMMLKSHAYRLMAYLMRNYTVSCLSPKDFDAHTAKLKRMNVLLEYISANYHEKITTADLAGLCYLSEGHLCRFFKKAVGKSVTGYINEYRIEKASVMLTKTEESITDIASNVGFDDANYFSRIFKRIKKMSPGEYRRSSS